MPNHGVGVDSDDFREGSLDPSTMKFKIPNSDDQRNFAPCYYRTVVKSFEKFYSFVQTLRYPILPDDSDGDKVIALFTSESKYDWICGRTEGNPQIGIIEHLSDNPGEYIPTTITHNDDDENPHEYKQIMPTRMSEAIGHFLDGYIDFGHPENSIIGMRHDRRIIAIEIINEFDDKQITNMYYTDVAECIKAAEPYVHGPGESSEVRRLPLLCGSTIGNTDDKKNNLKSLMTYLRDNSISFDGVSYHGYEKEVSGIKELFYVGINSRGISEWTLEKDPNQNLIQSIKDVRKDIQEVFGNDMKIYMTEFGFQPGGAFGNFAEKYYGAGLVLQSQYLLRAYVSLMEVESFVPAFCWFSFSDGVGEHGPRQDGFGLYKDNRTNGMYKSSSYNAFVSLKNIPKIHIHIESDFENTRHKDAKFVLLMARAIGVNTEGDRNFIEILTLSEQDAANTGFSIISLGYDVGESTDEVKWPEEIFPEKIWPTLDENGHPIQTVYKIRLDYDNYKVAEWKNLPIDPSTSQPFARLAGLGGGDAKSGILIDLPLGWTQTITITARLESERVMLKPLPVAASTAAGTVVDGDLVTVADSQGQSAFLGVNVVANGSAWGMNTTALLPPNEVAEAERIVFERLPLTGATVHGVGWTGGDLADASAPRYEPVASGDQDAPGLVFEGDEVVLGLVNSDEDEAVVAAVLMPFTNENAESPDLFFLNGDVVLESTNGIRVPGQPRFAPVTNGDYSEPELVFDEDGDVVVERMS